MRLKRELQQTRWDSSFKFAFVRNPYEWMRSWYRFRQRKALRSDSHDFRDRYTGDKTFNEFVQSFASNELMLKQSDFIANHEGELLVDFVGHYETLQYDFDRVCTRLSLEPSLLPVVNTSRQDAESEEPISRESTEIINDYFSRDFEMFDYQKL